VLPINGTVKSNVSLSQSPIHRSVHIILHLTLQHSLYYVKDSVEMNMYVHIITNTLV